MATVHPPRHFEEQGDPRDALIVTRGFELSDHKPTSGTRDKARYAVDRRRGYVSEISGLPNKKGLFSAVSRYRKERGLADLDGWIVFIDVNDLKKMNDEYNHVMGNALLKATGAILKKIVGLSAHLHGDEFIVYVPKTRPRYSSFGERLYHLLFNNPSREKRSDKPTDLDGLLARLDREFANHYIVFQETNGTVLGEFDISISRGAVEVTGRRLEDLEEAIESADKLMQEYKDARKAARREVMQAQYIDEKSGKTAFLALMDGAINHPDFDRIRELAGVLGINKGELSESRRLASLDPRVTELRERMHDVGAFDAARYLTSLLIGQPVYKAEDVGLLGVEKIGLGR